MKRTSRIAALIAAVYMVLGAAWILFSDQALQSTITDLALMTQLQTYKGWLYVAVNALLLYWLIREALKRFERQDQRDPLTNLYRHHQFITYLKELMDVAASRNEKVLLLHLDIDKFKSLNQELGYRGADSFLRALADKFRTFYQADTLLARLGTDQFVVARTIGTQQGSWEQQALALNRCFSQTAAAHNLKVSCCIGVALGPDDGDNARALLLASSASLASAREEGPDSIRLFNRALSEAEEKRQILVADLRQAIDERTLSLVYQPQFNTASGQITGCEVLVRWHHPLLGWVSPEQFVGLAEQHNLISALSAFVVTQTATELDSKGLLGNQLPRVSVNISALEFNNAALMEALQQELNGVPQLLPFLQLEITETAALTDLNASVLQLARLKQKGLRFAIDDFGTGYTSLMMLKELPIDEVKIDRAFIRDLLKQPRTIVIVEAITAMAGGFGINVVAEGVETREQLECLTACGCQEVQGYLLAMPMAIDELVSFLDKQKDAQDKAQA
ncbi:bifunctional diguanylate cyclase/phosphodiesterase [Bowmanella sp. Y26]|uniref:putative bifunctional diguanylate cyclase/phosphodiesterase n=1 Tax=Bowmanella yangjiangensis TaxID=2811230 RepID=UPI001BDCB3D6|nr:bifunctional diguanylate cyclase/phosphodiesterase [Bowmanella yangjiangensis]MBT1064729.1 bifunctional diguanylate cyclase/phosphodiesterase [Bowmanella yangjiangensis]